MQTLNTRTPTERPAIVLARCPFCGGRPYWMEVEIDDHWELHFYHPGISTDKDCLLAGRGFFLDEVSNWNRRYE